MTEVRLKGQIQALVQTDWRGPEPADFESCRGKRALGRARRQRSAPLVGCNQAGAAEAPTPFRDCKCALGFALRHAAAVLAKFLTSHEHCGRTLSRGEKRLRQNVPTF